MSNIALDKLKKDDLVKVARAMKQEIKLLKKTKVKQEVAAKDLPLLAISVVQLETGGFQFVKIGFDIRTGVAGVLETEDYQKPYQVFARAKKALVMEVQKQYVEKEKENE